MSDAVVLAVDVATSELTADDRVLAQAFQRMGVSCEPMVWGSSPAAPVVVRSTWDYVDRPAEFAAWLDVLGQTVVVNSVDLLRWNMHKRYLLDLEARGVDVVPTVLVERGARMSLDDLMGEHGWDEVVVKPAIGASARLTIRVDGLNRSVSDAACAAVLETEDLLVQPFVPAIRTHGELSIVAIDGVVTHVVHKQAASAEWRVQRDFGGSVHRIAPSGAHVQMARSVLAMLESTPEYARIDVVEVDGVLHLMELELIEPDLFFRLAPEAAEALVAVVLARIG